MTASAVRAQLKAVDVVIDSVLRFQLAAGRVEQSAEREVRRLVDRATSEHAQRMAELRAAERAVTAAASALVRCKENCGHLERELSQARQCEAVARQRAIASQRAVAVATEASSRFAPQRRAFAAALASSAVPALAASRTYREELLKYLATKVAGGSPLPVATGAIGQRTTAERIDLADDVHGSVVNTKSYGGYLDIVMHGDASGTQADIDGNRVDFSLDDTATMIRESPSSWRRRPIKLLSCSTGRDRFAQDLADRVQVPVYAPTDVLHVRYDGSTFIGDGGTWRRFEPGQGTHR